MAEDNYIWKLSCTASANIILDEQLADKNVFPLDHHLFAVCLS